nr:ribonuclease H-like domain-containing protein [Tanacetum cinerariifolium]
MGLDDCYMQIRSNILSRDELPDVRSVYTIISSEESHRVVSSSGVGTSQESQSSVFSSNMGNMSNAKRPQTFVSNSRPSNVARRVNSGNKRPSEGSPLTGTIFDSGANQHLTYTDKNLVNSIDISYLGIKVSYPNGIEALITKVARDSKFVVGFDESKCFLMYRDLIDVKILEIGRQVNVLYYFDNVEDILSGADNRPPMLEKDMYESWKSRMELYMMNRQHGRMIHEFVKQGPLIWPTIKENGVTRPWKYSELTPSEAIQADCDVKATNIILQGLPPEVYALVSNHKVAKQLWERIQLLTQGTSLTKQEQECKLYDEFDKFAYKKGKHFVISTCDALTEVNISNLDNNMLHQGVQERLSSEQSSVVNHTETEKTKQLRTQVMNSTKINLDNKSVNDTLTTELERYKEQVKSLKEGKNVDFMHRVTVSDSCEQSVEIDRLKQTLSEQTNYAIGILDSEENLLLAEESHSKMLLKQKDPMVLEKKVNTKPIDYAALNRLSKDFETRFIPQSELSTKQVYCPSSDPIPSNRLAIV